MERVHSGSFDLNRPVSRLKFAVLANRYLNRFALTVTLPAGW
jgi:hypothetical protein